MTPNALRPRLTSTIILALAFSVPAWAKTPVATGTGGAVATISEPASQAALAILNKGGNAIDCERVRRGAIGCAQGFAVIVRLRQQLRRTDPD